MSKRMVLQIWKVSGPKCFKCQSLLASDQRMCLTIINGFILRKWKNQIYSTFSAWKMKAVNKFFSRFFEVLTVQKDWCDICGSLDLKLGSEGNTSCTCNQASFHRAQDYEDIQVLQSGIDSNMQDKSFSQIKCFGFKNFGNTCYLNASLQLLGYVLAMPGARMESSVQSILETHRSDMPRIKVNQALASFVSKIQAVREGNHFKFACGQQHDSAEFIEHILQTNDNNLLTYQRTCLRCDVQTYQTQTAICIQVNAHEDTCGQVFDILHLEPIETVDMYCESCNAGAEFDNEPPIPSLPHKKMMEFSGQSLQSPFLFFHIQRFLGTGEKNHSPVVNSLEFDLDGRKFSLFGFINHVGTSNLHGHYTAFVRKQWYTQHNWVLFDDSKVIRLSSFPDNEFKAAYILLFIEDGYLDLADDIKQEYDLEEDNSTSGSNSNSEFEANALVDKGFTALPKLDQKKGKPSINQESINSQVRNIDHVFPTVQAFQPDFVENKEFGNYVSMEVFLENFFFNDETEDVVGIKNPDMVYNGFEETSTKPLRLSVQDGLNYNPSWISSEYDVDSITLLVQPSEWPEIHGSLSYTLIGKYTNKLLRHNHLYYQHGSQQLRLFRIPHFQLFQINDNISILVFFPNMHLPGTPLTNAVSEVTVEMFMNSCFLPGLLLSFISIFC